MFTGIIEELGNVIAFEKNVGGARIRIAARLVTNGTREGDSIAVNGVCLTALNIRANEFAADVSAETLRRSTLGFLQVNSAVNLERAVTPSTRLGGHIVQGHVDATGEFLHARQNGGFWTVRIGFPPEIAHYFVFKGSVAVEGISLTIAALEEDFFDIAVIPKTWQTTNLHSLQTGDKVNLEADVVAKYVERLLRLRHSNQSTLTTEKLEKLGFK
jgi:riboflavin synthase